MNFFVLSGKGLTILEMLNMFLLLKRTVPFPA